VKNSYEIKGNFAAIFVKYKGATLEALIDADDLEKVMQFPGRWYYCSGYIRGEHIKRGKIISVNLCRLVMDTPPELEVHHIDNNTLDNRKRNLKNVTRREHAAHMRKGNLVGRGKKTA
jgi:hypothetical protein